MAKRVLGKFVGLVSFNPIKAPRMRPKGLHFVFLDPKIMVTNSFRNRPYHITGLSEGSETGAGALRGVIYGTNEFVLLSSRAIFSSFWTKFEVGATIILSPIIDLCCSLSHLFS